MRTILAATAAFFACSFLGVSAEDTPAQSQRQESPVYPASCFPNDIETETDQTVDIGFDIDRDGLTENVTVLRSSDPCFEEAAVAAVRAWTYEPRRIDGRSKQQPGMQAKFRFSYQGLTSVDEFDAQPIERYPPDYPDGCARTASDLETIKVQFDVSKEGKTQNIKVIESSHPCLNHASRRAVDQWEFRPRIVNGEPAARDGIVTTIQFKIVYGREKKEHRMRRKVANELSGARALMQKGKIEEALARLEAYNEKSGDDLTPMELGNFHRLRGAARLATNDLEGALDDFRIVSQIGPIPRGSDIGRTIYELETALGVSQEQEAQNINDEASPAE